MRQTIGALHPTPQQQRGLCAGGSAVGMDLVEQNQRWPIAFTDTKQMITPGGVHLEVQHFRRSKQNVRGVAAMLLRITGDHDFTLIQLMLALRTGKHLTLVKDVFTTPNERPSASLLRILRVGLLAFHQAER